MFGMFGTSLELHPLPWSHQRWPQRGCLDVDSMEQPPRETASEHNSKMHVASCSKFCFSHYVLASFTHKTWKKHAGLEKG